MVDTVGWVQSSVSHARFITSDLWPVSLSEELFLMLISVSQMGDSDLISLETDMKSNLGPTALVE